MNVTGRDGYILAQALAFAIEVIDRLPEEWRPRSNRDDMLRLLEAMQPKTHAALRVQARATLQRRGITAKDGRLELAAREDDGPIVPIR
jgi:CelD/BcsL family acetyltransferase involved in cellulose biosynthesis